METIMLSISLEEFRGIFYRKQPEIWRSRFPKEYPFKVICYCSLSEFNVAFKRGILNDCRDYYRYHESVCGEFICDKVNTARVMQYKDGIESVKRLIYYADITSPLLYDKQREISEYKSVKFVRGYHKKGETKIKRLMNADRVEVTYLTHPPKGWRYIQDPEEKKS